MTTLMAFLCIAFIFICATGGILAIMAKLHGDEHDSTVATIFFIALAFLFVGMMFADNEEQRKYELRDCEWIVSNSGEYLLYGEPNR